VEVQGNGTISASSFLRPHLLKMAPYTPIEPFEVLSARYGRKPEDIIKLDANENPYGPPPEVRAALATMAFPHIYPDPETRQLRAALAKMNDVPVEHLLVGHQISPMTRTACPLAAGIGLQMRRLFASPGCGQPLACGLLPQVGCGADELIDLLMRCVLDPTDKIIDCPPTFTMCGVGARLSAGLPLTLITHPQVRF
jgi:histidinol-phosphate aminotransferase